MNERAEEVAVLIRSQNRTFVPWGLMLLFSYAWNDHDSAAFSQFHRGGMRGLSIRTGRFRYTEWRAMKSGKLNARELYDHENDPLENTDVAEQVKYRDSITTLSKRLQNQFE